MLFVGSLWSAGCSFGDPKPHYAEVLRCFRKVPDYVSSVLPPASTRTSSLPVCGSPLTTVPPLAKCNIAAKLRVGNSWLPGKHVEVKGRTTLVNDRL